MYFNYLAESILEVICASKCWRKDTVSSKYLFLFKIKMMYKARLSRPPRNVTSTSADTHRAPHGCIDFNKCTGVFDKIRWNVSWQLRLTCPILIRSGRSATILHSSFLATHPLSCTSRLFLSRSCFQSIQNRCAKVEWKSSQSQLLYSCECAVVECPSITGPRRHKELFIRARERAETLLGRNETTDGWGCGRTMKTRPWGRSGGQNDQSMYLLSVSLSSLTWIHLPSLPCINPLFSPLCLLSVSRPGWQRSTSTPSRTWSSCCWATRWDLVANTGTIWIGQIGLLEEGQEGVHGCLWKEGKRCISNKTTPKLLPVIGTERPACEKWP